MVWIAIGLLALAAVGFVFQHYEKKSQAERDRAVLADRVARIKREYAGSPFLEDILQGNIRQGMTRAQVIDAWGTPAAQDERVLKTKHVLTLKYGQISSRSYRQHVKIENGIVVGWTNR